MEFAKKYNIQVNELDYIGIGNFRGRMTLDNEYYNLDLVNQFEQHTGSSILGISGFKGTFYLEDIISIQNEKQLVLVDPLEDINVLNLKKEYENQGYRVTILLYDLWPFYMEIMENELWGEK